MKIYITRFNMKDTSTMDKLDKIIGHIKTNEDLYKKVIVVTAILIHINCNASASTFEQSLDDVCNQLLNMLMTFSKWSCLAIGLKSILTTILNGGNIRNAISDGLLYVLAYIFISIYPALFTMFKGIKF